MTTKVFTMRLDDKLVSRIDELVLRRYGLFYGAGTSRARPPLVDRSKVIRWLLEVGLEQVRKDLDRAEAKRKGGR